MLKTILLIFAVLFLIEGLILLVFPKQMNNLLRKISRGKGLLRKLAVLELIGGLILLLIAMLV